MGGLIALFLFIFALTIALFYLLRKMIARKEIPADVSRDGLIGGTLNLSVMLGSLFLFVILFKPFFLNSGLMRGVTDGVRHLLLFGVSFGLSYIVLLIVDHVFTGGQRDLAKAASR